MINAKIGVQRVEDSPPLLMSYSRFGVQRVVDLPPLLMTYSRFGVQRVEDLPPLSEHNWGAASHGLTPSCYKLFPNWGAARGVLAPSLTTQLKIGVQGASHSPPFLIIFSNIRLE